MAKINKDKNCKCDCQPIHIDKQREANIVLQSLNNIDEISLFFKNFSDSTRLKIMAILKSVGRMCVCDIAVALDMTKSAISHQLKFLKKCNLVKDKRDGKVIFYDLADEHVKKILDMGIEHLQEME